MIFKRQSIPLAKGKPMQYKFKSMDVVTEDQKITYRSNYKYIRPRNVNLEIKQFLEAMKSDFWLDCVGVRFDLIDFVNETSYNICLSELNFTEIISLYEDLRGIDMGSESRSSAVFSMIEAAIYQYIKCAKWNLHRKVLKILEDEIFGLKYNDLEESFRWIEHDKKWRYSE
jgi:hypothetical protein